MKIALLIFSLILCTACSAQPKPEPVNMPDATAKAALLNRQFQLTAVNGKPFTVSPEQPEPGLSFSREMIVSGRICNSFSGTGQFKDSLLIVPEMASTLMLCHEPELNELETAFFNLLHTGAAVSLDEQTGVLILSSNKLTLEYKPIN